MRRTELVVILGLLLLGIPIQGCVQLQAECITPPPPCEALKAATYVFLADIAHAGSELEEARPNEWRFVPQPVRFRVVEAFKGVPLATKEVDARILSASAEAILFRTGNRYLVYATREPDGIWSTACSRTKLVQPVVGLSDESLQKELQQLRKCKTPR